jgi:hypothetical protein
MQLRRIIDEIPLNRLLPYKSFVIISSSDDYYVVTDEKNTFIIYLNEDTASLSVIGLNDLLVQEEEYFKIQLLFSDLRSLKNNIDPLLNTQPIKIPQLAPANFFHVLTEYFKIFKHSKETLQEVFQDKIESEGYKPTPLILYNKSYQLIIPLLSGPQSNLFCYNNSKATLFLKQESVLSYLFVDKKSSNNTVLYHPLDFINQYHTTEDNILLLPPAFSLLHIARIFKPLNTYQINIKDLEGALLTLKLYLGYLSYQYHINSTFHASSVIHLSIQLPADINPLSLVKISNALKSFIRPYIEEIFEEHTSMDEEFLDDTILPKMSKDSSKKNCFLLQFPATITHVTYFITKLSSFYEAQLTITQEL